ncbi:MAG TPA: hypothetical protein VN328_13615, partial [Thermodesulfovibrionales bacterium]|nr:hypothetical protein [Thermodesulfovibrionales bacterium]
MSAKMGLLNSETWLLVMGLKNQKTGGHLMRGLSVSLIAYAVVCPISRSGNYFLLASLLLFSLYLWIREYDIFPTFGPLVWLAAIWLCLVVWRCFTMLVNGGGFSVSPILKTFNILPIFLLYNLPCNLGWKRKQAANAVIVLLSVTAMTIILGLFQKLSGVDYPFPQQPFTEGKLVGFLGYHIHAGGFFSTLAVLSICLVLFWRTSARTKMFLSGLFSILAIGLLFSMSRTYYISFFVTLPVILIRKSLKAAVIGMSFLLFLTLVTLS